MKLIAGLFAVLVLFTGCTEDEGESFEVTMSGSNEVCDDPDACGGDGSGTAEITLDADANEVCVDITTDVDGINASHIHEGEEGESGDPVVDLSPNVAAGGSEVDGCVSGVEEELIEDILADPAGYYVNVHTEELPDGAGRGQLSD